MPTPQTTANFEKFDSTSKWSSDLDYLSRFNWFVAQAAVNISQAWYTDEHPNALIDSLFQMEQAFMDAEVLRPSDTKTQPLKTKLRQLQMKLLRELPTAIHNKNTGNATQFFALRTEVNQRFSDVRAYCHAAGLTLKKDVHAGSMKDRLRQALEPPTLT